MNLGRLVSRYFALEDFAGRERVPCQQRTGADFRSAPNTRRSPWLAPVEKNEQRRGVRTMCHQVMCERCARPTWSGCGSHIEQALADVPSYERCTCDQDFASALNADSTEGPFVRVFGRGS
jgi:hypothetical protein